MPIESVMPSNHLILCHPLFLCILTYSFETIIHLEITPKQYASLWILKTPEFQTRQYFLAFFKLMPSFDKRGTKAFFSYDLRFQIK